MMKLLGSIWEIAVYLSSSCLPKFPTILLQFTKGDHDNVISTLTKPTTNQNLDSPWFAMTEKRKMSGACPFGVVREGFAAG